MSGGQPRRLIQEEQLGPTAGRHDGATDVARRVLERGAPLAPQGRPALVNGTPGVIVGPLDRPFSVVSFTITRGRIASVDVIVGPTITQ